MRDAAHFAIGATAIGAAVWAIWQLPIVLTVPAKPPRMACVDRAEIEARASAESLARMSRASGYKLAPWSQADTLRYVAQKCGG